MAKNMSKAPPNKKFKQTNLLSAFKQSCKKQTATDSEPGGTSQARDIVQKKMDYLIKKEVEEGPSKPLLQEAKEKKHTFQLCLDSETLSVSCKTSMTVLEALNTVTYFKDEMGKKKNMHKEILIQRSSGVAPRAAVKTDFPCCLIERDEIVYITLIKNEGTSSTNQQTTADPSRRKTSKPETLVTFWIKKEGGQNVQCLLKSEALRNRVHYVCVYAFQGEKVKTALKRDGRFNNVIFRKHCALSEVSSEIKHELSNPVDDLDGQAFQVVVLSDRNQPDSEDDSTLVETEPNVASDADVAETVGSSQNPINTEQGKKQGGNTKSTNPSTKQYVTKPIANSKEILGILRDQFPVLLETLQLRNKSDVQKFFRAEYGKSVENFLVVKNVKKLMKLSDSVCQIQKWGSAIGTGFLLFDKFILTNAHVIGEPTDLPKVSFADFTAVFDYEEKKEDGTDLHLKKHIPVKQLIDYRYISDEHERHLDYALLELGECNEINTFVRLLKHYSSNSPSNRHQICIVGYPGEGVKKMDPCIIIGTENRTEAINKHKTENADFIHVMTQKFLEYEFHKNQITYNSCFYHGSSGSPVFNADCELIGIHTGGYVYDGHGKTTKSVMEYAYSIQPIVDAIRAYAEKYHLDEITNKLKQCLALQ